MHSLLFVSRSFDVYQKLTFRFTLIIKPGISLMEEVPHFIKAVKMSSGGARNSCCCFPLPTGIGRAFLI